MDWPEVRQGGGAKFIRTFEENLELGQSLFFDFWNILPRHPRINQMDRSDCHLRWIDQMGRSDG